jgi:predicted component of type VI protein secretion system
VYHYRPRCSYTRATLYLKYYQQNVLACVRSQDIPASITPVGVSTNDPTSRITAGNYDEAEPNTQPRAAAAAAVKDTKDTIAKAAPKPAAPRAATKVSKSTTAKQNEDTQDDGTEEQAGATPPRVALTKQKSAKKLAPSAAADAVNSADDSTLTTTSTPPRREAPASTVGKLKKVSSVSANGLANPKAEQVGSEEKKVSEKGPSAAQRYKEAVSAKSTTNALKRADSGLGVNAGAGAGAGGDKEDGNALQKPRRRVAKPASSN